MADLNIDNLKSKIEKLVNLSIKYMGKEIYINSIQSFRIDLINNPEDASEEKYQYIVQYGYPESGCVVLEYYYLKRENSISVSSISVHTQPKNQDFVMINYAQQVSEAEIGINVNFGLDCGTKEYIGLEEMNENPNVLKLLDFAIDDLENAEILGECYLAVSEGSMCIPCCDCRNKLREKNTNR